MLFVDEIHRLSPVVEEILYPALEDFQLDIMIGEGPAARSIKLDLPPFTLVGATTRAGLLTSPLRDRFGIVQRLDFYARVTSSGRSCCAPPASSACPSTRAGATRLAQRSRGTPRIANRLLRRVRDYAEVRAAGHIDAAVAESALDLLEVDLEGFDLLDRRLLLTVIEKFAGGPVGIDSLAATLGEERDTLEDVVEPFLIQQGFLVRSARGRVATPAAWRHFGREPPRRRGRRQPAAVSRLGAARGEPSRSRCGSTGKTRMPAASSTTRTTCKFLERARSEWLRTLGIDQARLLRTNACSSSWSKRTSVTIGRRALTTSSWCRWRSSRSRGASVVIRAGNPPRNGRRRTPRQRDACAPPASTSDSLQPRPLPKALASQF